MHCFQHFSPLIVDLRVKFLFYDSLTTKNPKGSGSFLLEGERSERWSPFRLGNLPKEISIKHFNILHSLGELHMKVALITLFLQGSTFERMCAFDFPHSEQ